MRLGIVGQVARVHEQVFLRQVRRADAEITGLFLHLLGEFFQLLDHHAAVWQPERQARTDLVIEDEDLQFLAQFAMVALLGFFELPEIILQLLRVLPGRAVDALEHLVLLVAAPVRARHVHQLEGVRLDLLRAFHVRAAAQVRERIVLVDRDLRLLLERIAVLIQSAFFQPFDQFQLVGLVLEDLARLIGRDDLLHELVLALR